MATTRHHYVVCEMLVQSEPSREAARARAADLNAHREQLRLTCRETHVAIDADTPSQARDAYWRTRRMTLVPSAP